MATCCTGCGAKGVMGCASIRLSVAASARRFNAEHIARDHLEPRLAGDRDNAFSLQQRIFSRRAWFAAHESVGTAQSAIRENGDISGREKFKFADDPVAPAMVSLATRAGTNTIATNAERILMLERFHGRVPAIGHVSVSGARAI